MLRYIFILSFQSPYRLRCPLIAGRYFTGFEFVRVVENFYLFFTARVRQAIAKKEETMKTLREQHQVSVLKSVFHEPMFSISSYASQVCSNLSMAEAAVFTRLTLVSFCLLMKS